MEKLQTVGNKCLDNFTSAQKKKLLRIYCCQVPSEFVFMKMKAIVLFLAHLESKLIVSVIFGTKTAILEHNFINLTRKLIIELRS